MSDVCAVECGMAAEGPASSLPVEDGWRVPASGRLPNDLWAQLRCDAQALAVREPLMQRHLSRTILLRNTPAEMLASILALRLTSPTFAQEDLHALFEQVLVANPVLVEAATRDIAAVLTRDPGAPSALHVLINLKGFHALQVHRIAHALWHDARRELAALLANAASQVFGVDIHPAARIGHGIMLDHGDGIVIGETAVVGDDVSLLHNVTLGGTGKHGGDRHPKIGRGVLIGAGASVLGNIEVGAQSRIAAGSVVLRNIPPRCTVAGVPAEVVRFHCEATVPAFEMDQEI
jgi:serine O-acetyltransferase